MSRFGGYRHGARSEIFVFVTRSPIRIFSCIWCAHRKASISPFFFGGRDTRRPKMMVFIIKNGSPKMAPRRTVMAPCNRKNEVREKMQLLRLFCLVRIYKVAMILANDDRHQNGPSSPSRYTTGKKHHFFVKVEVSGIGKINIHSGPRATGAYRLLGGANRPLDIGLAKKAGSVKTR